MGARRLGGSIFLKILAVFAGALVVIAGYFWVGFLLLDWEGQTRSVQRSALGYATYIVNEIGHPPDTSAARAVADRLDFGIRIEGPGIHWASSGEFPGFADVDLPIYPGEPDSRAGLSDEIGFSADLTRGSYRYLISLQSGRFALEARESSDAIFDMLFMIAVLIGVYLLIRRLLRPVRTLSEGVERLRAGDLGVEMETRRSDELGRLIHSFNEMTRAVRERIRARDQLLLDVSHELRSPLTRMKVALDMMPGSPAKESIVEDIEDTEAMIASLLETERMGSRHGGLNRSRTDLRALLQDVIAAHAGSPPGVDSRLPAEPVWTEVDAERVRVLVGNLLSNALKYSPADGDPVQVSLREEDDFVHVSVEDHGVGIEPEDLTHVFEPFFRADRSRSRETGGYGLGLSLARRITESHGGTIEARSTPGVGTSIQVALPRGTSRPGPTHGGPGPT